MKQVIVMRTDLNMRKGKMIAQGGHAVAYSVIDSLLSVNPEKYVIWCETGMKKICVGIGSEQELYALCELASLKRIPNYSVIDRGDTEFHGEPTLTCASFGPYDDEIIDEVTGKLKLL